MNQSKILLAWKVFNLPNLKVFFWVLCFFIWLNLHCTKCVNYLTHACLCARNWVTRHCFWCREISNGSPRHRGEVWRAKRHLNNQSKCRYLPRAASHGRSGKEDNEGCWIWRIPILLENSWYLFCSSERQYVGEMGSQKFFKWSGKMQTLPKKNISRSRI